MRSFISKVRMIENDEVINLLLEAYDNEASTIGKQGIIKEITLYIKNIELELG